MTLWFNKWFSIVLLVVCNTNYEFTLADIDEAGQKVMQVSTTTVKQKLQLIETCSLFQNLQHQMNIVSIRKFPFAFIADEAFTLKSFMLRPFIFLGEMTATFINLFSITDCLVKDMLLKTSSGYQPVDFEFPEDQLQENLGIKKI